MCPLMSSRTHCALSRELPSIIIISVLQKNSISSIPQDTSYPSLHIYFLFDLQSFFRSSDNDLLIICNLEFVTFFFFFFYISQTRKQCVGILFTVLCCIVLYLVHFVGSLAVLYRFNSLFLFLVIDNS